MKITKLIIAVGMTTLLLPAAVTAGPVNNDVTLSGATKDELIQKAGAVRQRLDGLKWDLASTKDQTRDTEHLTIRSNITTAEAIYNQCQSLLKEQMIKISSNQLIGVDLTLSSITGKIIKARDLLDEARRISNTLRFTRNLDAAADRFNNLLKQAQDASGKTDNKIVNELIENALREKEKAVDLLKQGRGLLATEHFRFAENLLKKALDLALKDITAQELIARGMERLQNLTQKARAAATGNQTASELLRKANELKTQVRTALQENRYAIAIRLIQKTEELLLKAIELAGRDSGTDSAADIIERYTSLLNTVRELQKEADMPQAAKLVRNARELAEMGEQASAAGKSDLAADSYRKAVKLLLRAKELLGDAPAASTADEAKRKLAALKAFLTKAAGTIDPSGNRTAVSLLTKARGFHDRAAANIRAGKDQAALKQIQVARSITLKALELAGKQNDRPGTSGRLTAEMEQVARLVAKAVSIAKKDKQTNTVRLAARAEEMLTLARKAHDADNQPLCSEHLLTAARLAQRVLQLSGSGSNTAGSSDQATRLEKAKAFYHQLLQQVKSRTAAPEQAAALIGESEKLMKSAVSMEQDGNLEGALITVTSATNLLTKSQSMERTAERTGTDHEAQIEQIKSILNKASQQIAEQDNEDAKMLIGLAAGYLARAREALRTNHPAIADQQLTVARQMALKALQAAKSDSTTGSIDASRINAELKKLDDKLNQAKSRLGR